ncbi:MAG: hypothetical protein IJM79_08995 [Erysipelotrichaceae bacterium]|nr:hypothetical protein [Erysipelotrichaceae bacterium]
MIWHNFVLPLALTILFECLACYLLGIRTPSDQLTVILANVITNPLLNLINYLMFHYGMSDGMRNAIIYAILEPLVVVAEALIYRYNLNKDVNHWLLSLIANILSITGGLLCLKMLY